MEIFENRLPDKAVRKAAKNQAKLIRKYGDDRSEAYHLQAYKNSVLEDLNVFELKRGEEPLSALSEKPLIVSNIRMGFGHYRISMAMASCAKAMGYTPYWLDLNSFPDTTMTKIIAGQDKLYSMGSRLSQKFSLFNKLFWEPLNSEGFRKLSYNASDEQASRLMTRVFSDLPKDTPLIGTHAWAAQAAVWAGMSRVVNAIPDNWPMALHLAEGARHTVQTPSAFVGYKALRGMEKGKNLKPMPERSIFYTGHYIDHELVSNLNSDTAARLNRLETGAPLRFLISVGGAGAQQEYFVSIVKTLLPYINENRAALYINFGDHLDMYDALCASVPELKGARTYFDDFESTKKFAEAALKGEVGGMHCFCHRDIFEAVYSTNLLMRSCDALITKPSELAFYPVPKLMIKRVGGHEAWGAIRAAEVGDGTYEVQEVHEVAGMLELMLSEPELLRFMNGRILAAKDAGIYNGAYAAVKLAAGE